MSTNGGKILTSNFDILIVCKELNGAQVNAKFWKLA